MRIRWRIRWKFNFHNVERSQLWWRKAIPRALRERIENWKIVVESRIDPRGRVEWRDWFVSRFRSPTRSRLTMFRERNNVIDFQRGNVPEAGTEESEGASVFVRHPPRLVDESKFVIDVWTGAAMPASHNSSTSFPISTTDLARFPRQIQRVANLSLSLDSFIFLLPVPSRRQDLRFPILWKDLFDLVSSYARSFEKNFSLTNW